MQKTKNKKIENKEIVEAKPKVSQKDFEERVLALAEKGLTAEKIGESLRKEKIHSKEFDKKISKILKEKNAYEIPHIKNIEGKFNRVKDHYEKNKQDKTALRDKDRIFSKLRKIRKYHKITKK